MITRAYAQKEEQKPLQSWIFTSLLKNYIDISFFPSCVAVEQRKASLKLGFPSPNHPKFQGEGSGWKEKAIESTGALLSAAFPTNRISQLKTSTSVTAGRRVSQKRCFRQRLQNVTGDNGDSSTKHGIDHYSTFSILNYSW